MRWHNKRHPLQNTKPPFPKGGAAERRRVAGLRRSQFIRIISLAFLLIWMLPICTCAAADDCYTEYTPRSANSSVFYIDVYSRREVTAAVFELSFADNMVSYYSVVPSNSTATVRDHSQKGKVTAAFADSSAVSGKLCRFSFRALQTGSVNFTLHMQQAAGADQKLITGWKDHTLTVKLGKDDVVSSSSGVKRTDKASSQASSGSQRGGGKSELTPGVDDENAPPGIFDLRRGDNVLKWLLIGAGIPIFIGALLWIGILIGRRSKQPDKAKEKPGDDNPEPDDKTEDKE